MNPKIQVLLSTYNGEKYVIQQVQSILNQKDVDVMLLVRDDGSTDSTVELIESIDDDRIKLERCKNIGCTKSFLDLIEKSNSMDYYAFADQDDVWDEDKLLVGINAIKDYSVPAIYSSVTRIVDADLNLLSVPKMNPKTDLGSAFVKNYVAGCTSVFNRRLMELLKLCENPQIPYHDWWVNLVALSTGGVSIFDREPHMKYRQHEGNVVGAKNNIFEVWKNRLGKFLHKEYRRDLMANELLMTYSTYITSEKKQILKVLSEGKKHPLRIIMSGYFHTDNKVDDLAFKICKVHPFVKTNFFYF